LLFQEIIMRKLFFVIFMSALSLSASAADYSGYERGQVQQVTTAVVEDIRHVTIANQNQHATGYQYAGSAVGAATGAALGSKMGGGNARYVTGGVMGILGGIAGAMAADSLSNSEKDAVEIVMTLNDGRTISVVQDADANTETLRPGDKVRLIQGQMVRVVRLRNVM
jgi:outer membrane lipoprotein SlyB